MCMLYSKNKTLDFLKTFKKSKKPQIKIWKMFTKNTWRKVLLSPYMHSVTENYGIISNEDHYTLKSFIEEYIPNNNDILESRGFHCFRYYKDAKKYSDTFDIIVPVYVSYEDILAVGPAHCFTGDKQEDSKIDCVFVSKYEIKKEDWDKIWG